MAVVTGFKACLQVIAAWFEPGIDAELRRVRTAGVEIWEDELLGLATEAELQFGGLHGLTAEIRTEDLHRLHIGLQATPHEARAVDGQAGTLKTQRGVRDAHFIDEAWEAAVIAAEAVSDAQGLRAWCDRSITGEHQAPHGSPIEIKTATAFAIVNESQMLPDLGQKLQRLRVDHFGFSAKAQCHHQPP